MLLSFFTVYCIYFIIQSYFTVAMEKSVEAVVIPTNVYKETVSNIK